MRNISFIKIKIFSVILLLLFSFAGCTKNVSTTEPAPEKANKSVPASMPAGSTLYPLAPGSAWTYAAYDSVGRKEDIVNIRVVNTTRVGSVVTSLWLICGKYETDTAWVVQSHDTLSFHFQRSYYLDDMTLLYPLATGNSWKYQLGNYIVGPDETVSTSDETFPSCKHIKRSGFAANEFYSEEFWIDPNVGIVKIRQKDFVTIYNGFETNKVWTLISYNLK